MHEVTVDVQDRGAVVFDVHHMVVPSLSYSVRADMMVRIGALIASSWRWRAQKGNYATSETRFLCDATVRRWFSSLCRREHDAARTVLMTHCRRYRESA
jgi:hypothetical protein